MKLAIVSDLHANLQAWNAVLLDIRSTDTDGIVCLGDVIGYGPNPVEVLESVHRNVDAVVLGNHEAAICGKMDPSLFTENAQKVLAWTRRQLNRKALRFLEGLPLSVANGFFMCTHGEFGDPASYNYIIDPDDAVPSWQATPSPLLFVGHTHQPAIHVLGESGMPRVVEPQDFVLEENKRFIVNVGSVGHPRGTDVRACYCRLDTSSREIRWRLVPFDLDAYRLALGDAGIDEEVSPFLHRDPRAATEPIRQLLTFRPATSPAERVAGAPASSQLRLLRRNVKRWRVAAIAAAAVGLAASLSIAAAWRDSRPQPDILDGRTESVEAARGSNAFILPPSPVAAGQTIDGWLIERGEKRHQSVSLVPRESQPPLITLLSQTPNTDIILASSQISTANGPKFCFETAVRQHPGFRGSLTFVLRFHRKDSAGNTRVENYFSKEPAVAKADGLLRLRKTFTVPKAVSALDLRITGRFSGRVDIDRVSLVRVE